MLKTERHQIFFQTQTNIQNNYGHQSIIRDAGQRHMSRVLGFSPHPSPRLPSANPLAAWNEMGGGIPGGGAKTVQVAQKVTPGTQVSGSYTTGMELLQYFNPQHGLTGIFRVIISSVCHPSQNPKFHHVFPHFFSCQHLLYGQQHSLTSSSGK